MVCEECQNTSWFSLIAKLRDLKDPGLNTDFNFCPAVCACVCVEDAAA